VSRVSPEPFLALPLEVHGLLADVPLHDVSVVELPGGGPDRTLADVRALMRAGEQRRVNPVVRFLFGLRRLLGRAFGWDTAAHERPDLSYLSRITPELASRSHEPPGTVDGAFRVLYLLDREGVQEIRNATVHAFLAYALEAIPAGYRLYWAIYVKPVSWLTPIYMAVIEPFRRFLVYPALLGRLRRAWIERYLQA
jgi:hypothetical protein